MDGQAIIDETRDALRSYEDDLAAAYLFGSVARGTATARSDVDLALLYKQAPAAASPASAST
jgi:predicted nucleotidyltransferase